MDLLKSFKNKLFVARQFSLSDWLVLAEAWRMLFFFHLALRWVSYERLMIPPSSVSKKKCDISRDLIFAQQMHRLVGFASRCHLAPMTCLVKSLALQKMLYKRSIPAQVKIGAQKTQDVIFAHAWVEVSGKPIGESGDVAQKFHVLKKAKLFTG